ncbi:MAG: aminomethyl transferase family protein [Proteobacteria bacterium]|nr:aminomethyl transferase family protein [Pseudomonadota bacterium]
MTNHTLAPYQAPLLTTPFHARQAPLALANDWLAWGGYTTVNSFSEVVTEYFSIRNSATLYDISPMRKYRIAGPDAVAFMNRLLTRDAAKIRPGRAGYAVWCDDGGKVIDDGTVFRLAETEYRLNSQEHQQCWLEDSGLGFDVVVEDVSENIAGLALQGPLSCAVLKQLGLDGVAGMKPFDIAEFSFEGGALTVTRTGFTGDLGYELWVAPDLAETLWDQLMAMGALYQVVPVGSKAVDMARIEAGFIQTNTDFMAAETVAHISRRRSPFELSLDWLVDFDKGHFNGRRALLDERETGSRYRIVGLDIEGSKPAQSALIYHGRARQVGFVTSALWSPTAKRNIAIATLDAAYADKTEGLWAEIYVNKELKWDKTTARCRIVERPFYNPPRRRATPALDF